MVSPVLAAAIADCKVVNKPGPLRLLLTVWMVADAENEKAAMPNRREDRVFMVLKIGRFEFQIKALILF